VVRIEAILGKSTTENKSNLISIYFLLLFGIFLVFFGGFGYFLVFFGGFGVFGCFLVFLVFLVFCGVFY